MAGTRDVSLRKAQGVFGNGGIMIRMDVGVPSFAVAVAKVDLVRS